MVEATAASFDGSQNITISATKVKGLSQTDSRSTNPEPYDSTAYPGIGGLYMDFKYNTANGLSDGGTYNRVITAKAWEGTSGGLTSQLAFTDNGNMHIRTATSLTAWGAWYKVFTAKSPQSIALTGVITGSGTTSIATAFRGVRLAANYTTVTYYKMFTMPTSSSATHDIVNIQGVFGGWNQHNKSYVNISLGARDSLFASAHLIGNGIGSGDVLVYKESDDSHSVYLKLSSYMATDLIYMNVLQSTIVNTSSTTAPTGTLVWQLSTAKNIRFNGGKIYLNATGSGIEGNINSGSWVSAMQGNAYIYNTVNPGGSFNALYTCPTANGRLALGTGSNAIYIGYMTAANVSSGTNTIEKMAALMNEAGNGSWPGSLTATSHVTSSDRRLKEKIKYASLDECYDEVKQVNVYNFKYKDFVSNDGQMHTGFIADEIEKVIPQTVTKADAYDMTDVRGLNSSEFVSILWGAVKKLQSMVEDKDKEISGLRAEFENTRVLAKDLEQEIQAIKAAIGMA